jgi:adenylosuccinate lyase
MWLEVEATASEVLAETGIVPRSAALAIRARGEVDVARIQEIEAEVKHDVIAFTTAMAEKIGPESRWLHYGLTSNDVVDTAQALQIKDASALIRQGILALASILRQRALEFKHTPTIGRTHGIHAEPTTFGLKLLNWYAEIQRDLARFDASAEDMRVGKLSGAVGTFGHLKPEHEVSICTRLGLRPDLIATQVIQRDRHAAYIATLAVLASTLDKIAVEIRHLQRTEVREAEEFFSEKQKGSSSMPHKRNPITSEQISGLARVIRANTQAALENVPLWHERDISHSSVERIIFPDSTILTDYLLAKTTTLIEKLLVYPSRMLKNLESTGGLIFSGQLLLDLAEAGMSREEAYRLVQAHAMNAWKEDLVFRDLVQQDPAITQRLPHLDKTFQWERQLANVDAIFERVLA